MRATVVDPDQNGIFGFIIFYPYHRPKGQGSVRGGVFGFIIQLSTRCFSSMEFIGIIRSHPYFAAGNQRQE